MKMADKDEAGPCRAPIDYVDAGRLALFLQTTWIYVQFH
jgi:hypothetical protein